MILSDDDILYLSYIVDNPNCTVTDIVKSLHPTDNIDAFKKSDNRVRARLRVMVQSDLLVEMKYAPKRYAVRPDLVFKGKGEIGCDDLDERPRIIELDEYIVVVGPQNRIVIRPLLERIDE